MSFTRTLLEATNRVHECREHSAPGAPKESRWIVAGLRNSCTTLGDLLVDPELLRYLRSQDDPHTLEDARRLLAEYRESGTALARFLAAERDLFARAGLPVSATEHLLKRIQDVITEPRSYDRDEIVNGLTALKGYVCDRTSRTELDRDRAVLGGLRDFFGGLAVATLNGGLLAASVGLSGAASAASVVVGGMVAADGYTTIRKIF